jgi:hypothetical protein
MDNVACHADILKEPAHYSTMTSVGGRLPGLKPSERGAPSDMSFNI